MTPPPPISDLQKGYLILPAEYITSNPSFTLAIPMSPRLVSPHPYTSQDTLTLVRGPIVYCVEDVDNTWVKDHFKSVQLDPKCQIQESAVTDQESGDTYVALKVVKGASIVEVDAVEASPGVPAEGLDKVRGEQAKIIDELRFCAVLFQGKSGWEGADESGIEAVE